mgnify:CR=1 FL=1
MYDKLFAFFTLFFDKSTLFRVMFNISPMYRRSCGRIVFVSKDLQVVKIKIALTYKNKKLTLQNDSDEITFDIHKIQYPVNTMRHSFSFDYEGITYNLTDIRNQFVLYEICRYINGSYKE